MKPPNNWYNFHKTKNNLPIIIEETELKSDVFNLSEMNFTYLLDKSDSCTLKSLALKYLYSRGITDEEIIFYNLHYSPQGKYYGRIIVPFIQHGQMVSFVARTFVGDEIRLLNPVGKKDIFNLQFATSNYDHIIICEGVFDAIATGKNAIAVLGMHLSEYQIQKLYAYCHDKEIGIFFDSGKNSWNETLKLANKLSFYFENITLYKLPIEFKDPGVLNAKNFKCELKNIIENYEYSEEFYMKEMLKI